MAITVNGFGRNALNEMFILEAVTDDPTNVKFMRLEINGFTFENETEIGTNDTFRFELTAAMWVSIVNGMPELQTYSTSNNNTQINGQFDNMTLTELEEDGTELDQLFRSYYLKPYNLFENQNQTEFDCGDDGSSASKFLTNSPQTIRVKKDEFIWLFVDQADFNDLGDTARQEIVIQRAEADGTIISTDAYDILGDVLRPFNSNVPNFVSTNRPNPTGFQIKFDDLGADITDRVLVFVRDKSSLTQRSEIKILREYNGCEFVKLWWLNQYNAPELVYMEGTEIHDLSNVQAGFVQSEPVNPTPFQGGRKVYANKVTRAYQLNTGNRTPAEIIYLSEMLYSRELVIDKDGELIPVRITDNNFNNFNSKDSVFNLAVTLEEVKDTNIY